jgi:hypothetical protein
MNRDYTIVIHTDTPSNFDKIHRVLLGSWDARMVNLTTGDEWMKEGSAPETSTTAPVSFQVVEEEPRKSQVLKSPCGHFVAGGHEEFDPDCGACVEANSDAPEWTL